MYLFYCDESNLEERSGDFLIYGGLVINSEVARQFSSEIEKVRASFSVPRDYKLKFNPGPANLSHNEFIALKQAVIETAISYDAKILIYVILHDIATSADDARRNGINAVCYHFDCLLSRYSNIGLVLVDRFNDRGNQVDGHLAEKFSIGITGMPYSKEIRLNNIVGLHYSAIGQSHFPSIVDIVLGSFRFAINAHTRNKEGDLESARTILKLLSPLQILPVKLQAIRKSQKNKDRHPPPLLKRPELRKDFLKAGQQTWLRLVFLSGLLMMRSNTG